MRDLGPILNLPVDQIDEPLDPSRLSIDEQELAELAASMARLGLLEPIGVRYTDDPDRYALIYGHRRHRAARSLGWHTIPALILPADVSELEARQAENNQRVQLTPVEEAHELQRYRRDGRTVHHIAHATGRTVTWVNARLRLLAYPDDLLTAIHTRALPLAVADLLAQIDHPTYRARLTSDAIDNGATATTVSVWLQHYLSDRPRIQANADTIDDIIARRADYRIMAPCEYCGQHEELTRTRLWRLCQDCTTGLVNATAHPSPRTTTHADR